MIGKYIFMGFYLVLFVGLSWGVHETENVKLALLAAMIYTALLVEIVETRIELRLKKAGIE